MGQRHGNGSICNFRLTLCIIGPADSSYITDLDLTFLTMSQYAPATVYPRFNGIDKPRERVTRTSQSYDNDYGHTLQ